MIFLIIFHAGKDTEACECEKDEKTIGKLMMAGPPTRIP